MKALILAAGLGTRLGDLTSDLPKPMLPVGDEPLLAHTFRYLSTQGVSDIIVNLHHHAQKIKNYFGSGSQWGVSLTYSYEDVLLGTAGALKMIESQLPEGEALVIYGDLLLSQELAPLIAKHRQQEADATLFVHWRARSNSILELEEDGRVIKFQERPPESHWEGRSGAWVNSGVQLVKTSLLSSISVGAFADLPKDIYVPQIREKRIYAVPMTGFRIAIDSPERYREAIQAVADGQAQ